MYRVVPEGDVSIGIGGSTSVFVPLAELTSSGISHERTGGGRPPLGLSPRIGQQPARPGRLQPGTASYGLIVDESNEAVLDAQRAAIGGLVRAFREQFGFPRKVHDNDAGTTVEIAAATSTLTLAERAGGAQAGDVDVNLGSTLQPSGPIDLGRLLVIDGVAYGIGRWADDASACRVYRVGAVTGTLVKPDTVALADVAATATWEVHEWAIRYDLAGVVTAGPGHAVGGDSNTATISVQLYGMEKKSFVLGA